MSRYILIRRLRGPAFLLLVGVNALLAQAHILGWGHSWPFYLILAGLLALAERAALAVGGLSSFSRRAMARIAVDRERIRAQGRARQTLPQTRARRLCLWVTFRMTARKGNHEQHASEYASGWQRNAAVRSEDAVERPIATSKKPRGARNAMPGAHSATHGRRTTWARTARAYLRWSVRSFWCLLA